MDFYYGTGLPTMTSITKLKTEETNGQICL